MSRRKPAPHVPVARYKDVRRQYHVCDRGHRFYEDYQPDAVGRNHGYCVVDGCAAPVELDFSSAPCSRIDGRVDDGTPWQLVEVPADHATLPSRSPVD